ncbi:MAG: hypothetical protein AAGC77_04975 [Pseudomonadota bacterium]
MDKDLKKEQVDLLKFEKQLLGLGAGLSALTAGAAASASDKVGDVAVTHTQNVQQAYLNLVETVQAAHDAIETSAAEAGFRLLQARGTPKEVPPVAEVAKSILGIG